MKTLTIITITTLLAFVANTGFAGPRDCVRETAKAASDCIKGNNDNCKNGIDRVDRACFGKK